MAYARKRKAPARRKAAPRRRATTTRRRAAPARAQTVKIVIEHAAPSVAAFDSSVLSARETQPKKAKF